MSYRSNDRHYSQLSRGSDRNSHSNNSTSLSHVNGNHKHSINRNKYNDSRYSPYSRNNEVITKNVHERRHEERSKITEMNNSTVWNCSPREPSPEISDEDDDMLDSNHDGSINIVNNSKKKSKLKKNKHKREKKKHKKSKKSKTKIISNESDNYSNSSSSEYEGDKIRELPKDEITWGKRDVSVPEEVKYPGPQIVTNETSKSTSSKEYGGALLPGEGESMAQYVAEGKRIPRRGEIGLDSKEIVSFEDVGYVMSGSRHRRMEAVRIRKENQIYNADDRRALALFNYEERAKREAKLLSDFRAVVHKKLQSSKDN